RDHAVWVSRGLGAPQRRGCCERGGAGENGTSARRCHGSPPPIRGHIAKDGNPGARSGIQQSGPDGGKPMAHRPTIMVTRLMVAACQYLAAEAGFKILEAGGNAIDAGVATGIALGVVQPEYVNFAGVAPIIIYSAPDDRVFTIPGLGTWPKAIARDHFKKHHAGKIPQGILRTIVPAAPDAWITALARFGTMSFGEVAQSAIGFARDGFPVYPLMSEIITEHEAEYRMFPSNVALYLPQGRPPRSGEVYVQKALAATIQYMADQESAAHHRGREAGLAAARDAFYRGDIAQV